MWLIFINFVMTWKTIFMVGAEQSVKKFVSDTLYLIRNYRLCCYISR